MSEFSTKINIWKKKNLFTFYYIILHIQILLVCHVFFYMHFTSIKLFIRAHMQYLLLMIIFLKYKYS